jgi:hypothetical protein
MSISAPEQGDPTRLAFALAILAELESLRGEIGQSLGLSGLPNASFESDTDADGIPDAWMFTAYTGGSGLLDDTTAIHGRRAFVITSPGGTGNGGGYLETTDFIAVSPNRQVRLAWELKSSAAEIHNRVELRWYAAPDDADYLSTTILWQEDTANAAQWMPHHAHAYPPAAARYAKVRLIGGDPSDDTAGSVGWDDLRLLPGGQLPVVERYLVGTAGGTEQVEVVTASRYQEFAWICPAGVTEIHARLWGGGGMGWNQINGHFGGGAGGYAEARLAVTPGRNYTVRVGYGGTMSYHHGGTSQLLDGATALVKAAGGLVGNPLYANGTGGTANVGDLCISGQSGQPVVHGGIGGCAGRGGAGGAQLGQVGLFPGGGGAMGQGLGANGLLEIEY